MKKQILPFLLAPLISLFSNASMALVCNDDPAQNIVSSNNYIFQILDYIDTPTTGFQKEIRTATTTLDKIDISTSKRTLNYNRAGMIIKSDYDLYSKQNELLYSERLNKTTTGWENIIEDFEDKRSSIVSYTADKLGRIVEAQQAKKASDFIFIETDTYQYDNNNCLIHKQSKWQLKEINTKGEFTGEHEYGSSTYAYQYENNLLSKVLYNFSNDIKSENILSYMYGTHNRLVSIQSTYSSKDSSTSYITQFLTFNSKNDWLSAQKQRETKNSPYTMIKRDIIYY